MQTRLPGKLALELEGIATEYEADLMYYQQETLDTDRHAPIITLESVNKCQTEHWACKKTELWRHFSPLTSGL